MNPIRDPEQPEFLPAVSLAEIWRAAQSIRWKLLVIVVSCFVACVSYFAFTTRYYRAEVAILPRESKSVGGLPAQLAQLSGLASLAGVNIGGQSKEQPIAFLKSKGLARRFIERHGLVPELVGGEVRAHGSRWTSWLFGDPPDVREATDKFMKDVWDFAEDRKTGVITVSITWPNAANAASWANEYIADLNSELQERALAESRRNVSFLRSELKNTEIVSLQQGLSRLLESEMQQLMIAQGAEEFAFRVIDSATVPRKPVSPDILSLFLLALAGSIFLSGAAVVVIVLRESARAGSFRRS